MRKWSRVCEEIDSEEESDDHLGIFQNATLGSYVMASLLCHGWFGEWPQEERQVNESTLKVK